MIFVWKYDANTFLKGQICDGSLHEDHANCLQPRIQANEENIVDDNIEVRESNQEL